jgi:DNA-binding HxlR family transcriptional regulator
VLWELRDGDALTFRALQQRCGGVSSSVLSERLRELRDAGIVVTSADVGYRLTADGAGLLDALAPLNDWSRNWARNQGSDL